MCDVLSAGDVILAQMLRKAVGRTAGGVARRTTSTKVAAVAGSFGALGTASVVFGCANLVGFGVSAATGSHLHLVLLLSLLK
jgi:hypothetical protein